jgi:outer membrane protein TolC
VLKINALTQKTLKRQLQSFKNKSKAKLDLSLGVKSTGEHNNYSDSLTKQSPAWKIGLGLSYPLGGVESNSNINKTNIQLLNLKQVRQEQWLNIYTQAKILQEKINLLEKLLQANQKQINIAKARTIEERKRYDDSNGQASFVINAQNNEQSVQLSYAQAAKNYQKTVLKFKATIDQLVK